MQRLSLPMLFALACTNDKANSSEGSVSSSQEDTQAIQNEIESEEDTASQDDSGIETLEPQVLSINIEPVLDCSVCATAVVTLDMPAPVTLVMGKEGTSMAPWVRSDDAVETHRIPLLELHSETTYRVSVWINGTESDEESTFTTAPLPDSLPPIELTIGGDIRQQSGLTLINALEWANPDGRRFFVIAVDEDGKVVWYHQLERMALALDIDEHQRIYTTDSMLKAVRIDPYGQTKTEWSVEDLGIESVHHDFQPTADGGMALISTELQVIDGWDPTFSSSSLNIVADRFMFFDAEGHEVWSWNMLDHLNPQDHYTSDLHMNFWDMPPYLDVIDPKDWSHANALVQHEDNWIVSLRNLDWLMEINPITEGIEWIFGPNGDFSLSDGSRWFSRQHRPSITEDGHILLYDNGLERADETEPDNAFSRVVEYALDHENMTATEQWSWDGGERYVCPISGDIHRLENGNHFINDGAIYAGIVTVGDRAQPHYSARLREIVGTEDPEIIWELILGSPDNLEEDGWFVYRAERIESLYPAWVRPE